MSAEPSHAGQTTPGLLLIVSAPSGGGKTSLVNALLNDDDSLAVTISHTTRDQRPGEANGRNYHFVAPADFQSLVRAGAFLEHAEVFGNFYGTSRQAVDDVWDRGKDVVLEIDWQGARQIQSSFAQTVSVFILPPSKRALRERLTGRGQDAEGVIDARMAKAISEMSHYTDYDYLIINDDFDKAVADLQTIVRAERMRRSRQEQGNQTLLRQLLDTD